MPQTTLTKSVGDVTFISSDGVAQRLGVTRRTVNGYFKTHVELLKPIKLGALLYIKEDDFPKLLEALQVK